MKLEEFLGYISEGREFEFTLNNLSLYMCYKMEELNGKEIPIWYVYDTTNPHKGVEIFHGTEAELLEFDFGSNITFKNSLESFTFEWIL